MTELEKIKARVKSAKCDLDSILRYLRGAHQKADLFFKMGDFDGGKMRNLDDALQWATDARNALTEFLK